MAKNPIKVMSSMLTNTIYAGRVNEKTGMFIGEKDVVTDTACSAVASYLHQSEQEIHFSMKGKKLKLTVVEVEEQ